MRWAFWRRGRSERTADPASPAGSGPTPSTTATPVFGGWARGGLDPAPRDDERDPDGGRAHPAFSGASPQHDVTFGAQDLIGVFAEGAARPEDVDLAAVRGDLVALVRAVLVGDRPEIERLERRVEGYDEDAASLAFVAGVALLGECLIAAAGLAPERAQPGSPGALAAIAEGDRVAGRAEPLLRELAPRAVPELTGFLVRFSVGMPELAVEPDAGAADHEVQVQVTLAVLLAQVCLDGHETPDGLAARLAELLPG